MATYQRSADHTRWLVEVSRKLSPDGFQLMKALYSKTLPQRILSNDVKTPQDLYDRTTLESDRAGPPRSVQERECMPPQDSLALFIHRLKILVPQSTEENWDKRLRELKSKDLGAQDCLESLSQCGVVAPLLRVLISQESKLLECLVRSYVNLTFRQRLSLKRELARLVGGNAGNETIFEIFSELFQTQECGNKCRNIVTLFITSLKSASCPRAVYKRLQQDLETVGIPHGTIPIPDCDPEPEIDDELTSFLNHRSRKSSRKMISWCLGLCLPILLGLLVIIVAFPLFSSHLKDKQYYREVSGSSQVHCPNTENDALSDSEPVAVLVGRLNSFWWNYVSLSQEMTDSRYVYSTIKYFVIPAHHFHVHSKHFTCYSNKSGYFDYQLYMLQKSTINFTVCIQSTNSTSNGESNITICDSWLSYSNYRQYLTNNCLEQHHLFIEPNGINCTTLNFTAPRDSFYYLTTASRSKPNFNARVDSYRVTVNLRYLNSSDWSDKSPTCTSTGYPSPNSCHIWIERNNLFHAEEYAIIATNAGNRKYGNISVEQIYRKLAYVVPALVAAALILLGLIIVCLCGILRKVMKMRAKRPKTKSYGTINNQRS